MPFHPNRGSHGVATSQGMNRDMVNAAYDLGATQWQMLREVMLPYLTPGIIAGYFMALPIHWMTLQ